MFIFDIMNIEIKRYLTLCIIYETKIYDHVINSLLFLKGVFLFKRVILMRCSEGLFHIGQVSHERSHPSFLFSHKMKLLYPFA